MTVGTDAESVPGDTVLEADVAIVGAGAAGITIARELAGTDVRVCLLESGGLEREDRAQELSVGEIVGTPYWPLDQNRERSLGGTTNLWAGWCRPLDDIDFAPRDWVPRSGWPINGEVLAPYYRRAHDVCQLGPCDYGLATWERELHARRLPLDERTVVSKMFQLSPPTRFGAVYIADLARAANVQLVHHATVLELETNDSRRAVTGLRVGTFAGHELRVVAKTFVLATGGLENARLLLLSRLGNDHDQVGRCFMEHLHFRFGLARLRWPRRDLQRLYSFHHQRAMCRLFLTPEAQEENGVLQGNVMLDAVQPRWPGRGVTARLAHTLEQAPDLSSRLTLSDQRDRFGLPRILLDWRVGQLEHETFRHGFRAVARAVADAGLGTVGRAPDDDPEDDWPPSELQGSRGHHMGTTRMSDSPRDGVVDRDSKVHGVANLFVAGSSVFPTSGAGTPTLTIVALAIRLADHLRAMR